MCRHICFTASCSLGAGPLRQWVCRALLALLASLSAFVDPSVADEGAVAKTSLFDQLDKNADGFVTLEEVDAAKQRLLSRLIRTADQDHDGKLSRTEFQAGLPQPPVQATPAAAETPATPPIKVIPPPTASTGDAPAADAQFRRMDSNGDGRVTAQDIPAARREGFKKLLNRADTDRDGALSPQELAKVRERQAAAKKADGAPDGLWKQLVKNDKNGDGKLSQAELPERLQKAFRRLDANGDGVVDEHEMTQARERRKKLAGQGK